MPADGGSASTRCGALAEHPPAYRHISSDASTSRSSRVASDSRYLLWRATRFSWSFSSWSAERRGASSTVARAVGLPRTRPERLRNSSWGFEGRAPDHVCILLEQTCTYLDVERRIASAGITPPHWTKWILAFGNSDGDQQMLEYTDSGDGPRLILIVHHDDAEREFAYDRKSSVGKFDTVRDEAMKRGWNVVSMKDDWKTIFAYALSIT